MKKFKYLFLVLFALLGAVTFVSCGDDADDDYELGGKVDYDELEVNGEKYACYGYRCPITLTSVWYEDDHEGQLILPCGKLSDAKEGDYDFDEIFTVDFEGDRELKQGSKLENFNPTFAVIDNMREYDYVSGSATVKDIKFGKYITVKFSSFKFGSDRKSYVLNGTVQLHLEND